MPTDYRSLYDKDYIGAWDLTDGDRTIKITRVKAGELTSVGGRKSKKPVIFFEGSDKGFALNATNGKTIAALYGNYVEKWVGKSITLYKSTTRSPDGSGDVECLRVRPQVPKSATIEEEELLITDEQANELEALCTEGGVDLTAAFKARAAIEKFAQLPASKFKGAKKWITDERMREHEGSQP